MPYFVLILMAAVIIGNVALWITSLVSILKRKDFGAEKKAIWIILCLVAGNLASIIYFFLFGRKKLGWATLICMLLIVPMVMMSALLSVFFNPNI